MRKKKYIFTISSILLLLSGYFFLPLWGSSLSIQFTIPKGSNTKTIAHILKEKKIFFYPNLFILTARIFNKSKRIHSGDYELNNKISTWQLLRMLGRKRKNFKNYNPRRILLKITLLSITTGFFKQKTTLKQRKF